MEWGWGVVRKTYEVMIDWLNFITRPIVIFDPASCWVGEAMHHLMRTLAKFRFTTNLNLWDFFPFFSCNAVFLWDIGPSNKDGCDNR